MKDVTGIISWLREWFDDIYALKGDGGNISLNDVYPVGSIYMSASNVDPATLFGGTWERIQDKFLLCSGSTYSPTYDNNGFANKTGGSADAVVIKHNHTQNAHNHSATSYNFLEASSISRTGKRAYTSNSDSGIQYLYTSGSYTSHSTTANKTATNQESGVDGAGKNMPPYLVVNVWKRTA